MIAELYANKAQLRTLQDRGKRWLPIPPDDGLRSKVLADGIAFEVRHFSSFLTDPIKTQVARFFDQNLAMPVAVDRKPTTGADKTDAKLVRSMSPKDCSPEHTSCKDFFGRLNTKIFYLRNWQNIITDQFIQAVDSYILWDNEMRIKIPHDSLSPIEGLANLEITT